MVFTPEHLRRRVEQELQISPTIAPPLITETVDTMNVPPQSPGPEAASLQTEFTFTDRVKGALIEGILPRLNLTSYNNLKRARYVANSNIVQVSQLHQQIAEQNATFAALQQQYGALVEREKALAEQYNALKQQHKTVDERDWVSRDEYESLADDHDALTEQYRATLDAYEQALARHEEVTAELQRVSTELKVSTEQRTLLENQIAQLKAGLRFHEWQNQMLLTMLDRRLAQVAPTTSPEETPILSMVERATEMVHYPGTRDEVRALLLKYFGDDGDHNLNDILEVFEKADEGRIPFWDIRIAARVMSRLIKPERYLEIGTRRGWSLAQVLAESPEAHCYIFDLWVDNYALAPGSPTYVLNKMREITGQEPQLTFVNGNSHNTLPLFFQGKMGIAAPDSFDLITVDGDHSLQGAWEDLYDIFPKVRVGGAILFDDLDYAGEPYTLATEYERDTMPGYVSSLRDVWRHFHAQYPNFVYIDCHHLRFQAGIAVRVR